MTLIIFDCDGVLVETESLANQIEVDSLKALGYNFTLEEYIDLALGLHNHRVEALLKEKYHIDLPKEYWEKTCQKQKEVFEAELVAVEGISHALATLPNPKCVASSSNMQRLHLTLGITHLLPYFDGRIYSTEFVKRGKPFPDIYLYAAEKMGFSPAECVVIEDSLAGIEGALAAKMTVLAFGGGKHITPRMRERLQASGASRFFDSMQDLPAILQEI